ncbi:MAG TPA: hypothetical protein DDZ78_12510 [Porphyromonadaceae bacterium]|nr:hypothetical protein [Porphyromonadaceae bacterium]
MNKYKRVISIYAYFVFIFVFPIARQETVLFPGPKSGNAADNYKLTVEPAWVTFGQPNKAGKSRLEKRFFPGHNRMVEFFFSHSFLGPHGFRIDTIGNNNYIMEVTWVKDFKEVNMKLTEEFSSKSFQASVLFSMSKEEQKEIAEYNRNQRLKKSEKAISEYTIETKKISVTPSFAGQMYKTCYWLMRNYFSEGIPIISFDGYSVTFRCVVGDFSLWTFSAINPFSVFKEFTTTCNEIVKEVQKNGKIVNEETYILTLNSLLLKTINSYPDVRIPGTNTK